jgi:hypothetical protein
VGQSDRNEQWGRVRIMKTISVSLEDLEGILRENRELQSRPSQSANRIDDSAHLNGLIEIAVREERRRNEYLHAEVVRLSK